MVDDIARRARLHAALADPARLAIVDELGRSDRSPSELGSLLDMPGNLLAHHLRTLEEVGLVERVVSSGDRRRRYVRLRREPLALLTHATGRPIGTVVFVCTHNAARSQLAAALWHHHTGDPAASAGTHPTREVHPGTVDAARRAGLDLADASPRHLDDVDEAADLVITVCDRAHEELAPRRDWWHWSVPDPIPVGTDDAFDRALHEIDDRIRAVTEPGGNP